MIDTAAILQTLGERLTAALGPACALRKQARGGAVRREELRPQVEAELRPLLAAHPEAAAHPWIARRLVDLALDDLFSERIAPPPALPTTPEVLADVPLHGLVFSAFPHVTNELYPLLVDAVVASLEGRWTGLAVGVHVDWLREGRPTRAILYDVDEDRLIEADLAAAPPLTTAQALMLNLRAESEDHARIAAAVVGARLLNPPDGARRLDDKAATAAIWTAAGLPTPRCLLVTADTPDAEVAAFRATLGPRAVRKPVDGTEGRGVTILDANGQPIADPATGCGGCGCGGGAAHESDSVLAGTLARQLPYLLCEERGRLRVAAQGGPVRLTVRLNVTCDGAVVAESGYAQVAAAPGAVASVGRGGRMVPLTEVWSALCTEDGTPVTLTPDDWATLPRTAQEGVAALAAELRETTPALIGVDLLLDLDDAGRLLPVLLEANPRPAGLSHARLVTPTGPTQEPGVTGRLWEMLG